MRTRTTLATVLLPLFCLAPASAGAGDLVDLTHAFDEQTIYWPTATPFSLKVVHKGPTKGGFHYEANDFTAAEHGGTHLDSPNHFAAGKWAAHEIPVDRLVGAGVMVDVSAQVGGDADYLVSSADVKAWEAKHGPIEPGAIVLIRTGWGARWPDKKRYLGTAKKGDVANLHFPGLSEELARWLVTERKPKGVGIDTPSVDRGQSTKYRAHVVMYEQNVYGLENVAHLEKLPPRGFKVWALPMPIRGGSGAPCRIVAEVPSGGR